MLFGAPYLENDLDDDLGFGKRKLTPSPIAKRIKISRKLLRTAALNPEQLVRQRLADKFAVTEEKVYMTGDGHKKPLSVFTPSKDGIPTSRDCAVENTATILKADNLIEAVGSLKAQYSKKAVWLFQRDAITRLRKLKDSNGQYLWVQGIQYG